MIKDKNLYQQMSPIIIKSKEQIASVGYTKIKQFFSGEELDNFEAIKVDLFLLQAQKISEYKNKALDIENSKISNFEKFLAVYEKMEHNDKEALY